MSEDEADRARLHLSDRLLELIVVLLLGATTLGTAWCGFQASQWSNTSSDFQQQASDQQLEANRLFGLATQTISYDNTMVAQYAQATAEKNQRLMDFYRRSLIRPGFLPVLQRWQDDIQAGRVPPNLTQDQSYLDTELGPYRRAAAVAQLASRQAQHASDVGNDYVAVTILLAAALFFAGVTSSFRSRTPRLLLVLVAALIVVGVAGRLATLPLS